jgi:alcohol dehydrogenase
LGDLAIQYSESSGFPITAITHSKDNEEVASKIGDDSVVDGGDALKQSGGSDIILATYNSCKAVGEALKGLTPNGRLVLMGFSGEPLVITAEIIANRWRILGSTQNDRNIYEAPDFVAKGKVRIIAETYSLDDIAEAYEKVASGNVRFRAVINNKN